MPIWLMSFFSHFRVIYEIFINFNQLLSADLIYWNYDVNFESFFFEFFINFRQFQSIIKCRFDLLNWWRHIWVIFINYQVPIWLIEFLTSLLSDFRVIFEWFSSIVIKSIGNIKVVCQFGVILESFGSNWRRGGHWWVVGLLGNLLKKEKECRELNCNQL